MRFGNRLVSGMRKIDIKEESFVVVVAQASGEMTSPFSEMRMSRKAAYLVGGVEYQESDFGGMKFEILTRHPCEYILI